MKRILPIVMQTFIYLLGIPSSAYPQEPYPDEESSKFQQESRDAGRQFSSEAIKQILATLDDIENLIVKEFSGGAVLQGELLSPEDLRRVVLVSNAISGIVNLCSLHPGALDFAAEHIKTIMKQNRIGGMDLSVLGNSLLLTGIISGEADVNRIIKICEALHIPLINGTRSAVADPRMVLFEVSFTEINRDAFEELGVRWPTSTTLANSSGIRIGSLVPAHTLEVTIDHLVHEGKARIISKPRLVCGSGQEASFQAGGELPIPKSDTEGRLSITWKPYGIILQISPLVDPEGIIHTRISSEISMVDQANAVDGIPGILTRRVDTHLSLSMGQTVVLSGLVHSDDAERVTKVPFLGDVPILGEIFTSRSFQKRETELVIFLSPHTSESIEGERNAQRVVRGIN